MISQNIMRYHKFDLVISLNRLSDIRKRRFIVKRHPIDSHLNTHGVVLSLNSVITSDNAKILYMYNGEHFGERDM